MMKRVKVKLAGKGTEEEPFTVNLPTWTMDGNPDYVKKECYILMNDDETEEKDSKTVINQQRIRAKYKNWKAFNASDVEINE